MHIRGVLLSIGILITGLAGNWQRQANCVWSAEDKEDALAENQPPGSLSLDRLQFAVAMSKIEAGMPKKDILALLGKPDDIWTEHDAERFCYYSSPSEAAKTREIWCYGTNGHLTLPTLGYVYIGAKGNAQSAVGGRGKPIDPTLFQEDRLRELLRIIDRTPPFDASNFDPLLAIQVINTLQPLGKEKALAVIDEYLRIGPQHDVFSRGPRDGLFLVLRALFDVPDAPAYMPWIAHGTLVYPTEALQHMKRLPRFPILLVDDIPLLHVTDYWMAGGYPQSVESHVEYFRKNGRIRSQPLVPTSDPLAVHDKLRDTIPWNHESSTFRNQLIRLVDTIYRKEGNWYGYPSSSIEPARTSVPWQQFVAEIAKLDIRWNSSKNCYTFKDGTTLPPRQVQPYRREVWKLGGPDGELSLIVGRSNKQYIHVIVEWSSKSKTEIKPVALRVLAGKDQTKVLAEFKPRSSLVSSIFGPYSYPEWSFYEVLKLNEGERVQIDLRIENESKLSPVYTP